MISSAAFNEPLFYIKHDRGMERVRFVREFRTAVVFFHYASDTLQADPDMPFLCGKIFVLRNPNVSVEAVVCCDR